MSQGVPTNSDTPPHLDTALSYAARGWPVFPLQYPIHRTGEPVACSCAKAHQCERIGKHPVGVSKWREEASSSAATVRAWWEKQPHRNIALVTGRKAAMDEAEEGGGFIVFDIDEGPNQKGVVRNGLAEMQALQAILGPLPFTMEAASGSGGTHLFYRHPGGNVYIPNSGGLSLTRDGQRHDFKGLQLRGDGGYVVAAPSLHASGRHYLWCDGAGPDDIAIAELPPAYVEWLSEKPGARMADVAVPEGNWPPEADRIRRARAYIQKCAPAVQGENGSATAFLAAQALVRGFCLPQTAALDLFMSEYNGRCSPPWSEAEVKHKIRQATFKGKREYGFMFSNDIGFALAKEEERLAKVIPIRPRMVPSPEVTAAAAEPAPRPDDPPPSGPQPVPPEGGGGGGGGGGNDGGGDGEGTPAPGPRGGGNNDDGSANVHHEFVTGDHVELARVTLDMMRRGGRHIIFAEERFWRYDPSLGLWQMLDERWIEGQVNRFSSNLVGEDKILKLRNTDSSGTVKTMKSELAREATPYSFLAAPTGMAFRNGFVRVNANIQEGTCAVSFVPHSPEHMARHRIEAKWHDDYQSAPMLDRFFEVLFGDIASPEEREKSRHLLQEFLGAAIFGFAPKFEKCLFLEGPGSNGKSQVIALFETLFPTPDAVSHIPPHEWGKPFGLEKMILSRLNVCSDIASNDMRDDQLFKQIVTGDSIQINRKHEKAVSVKPTAAHLLAANTMPISHDSTHGFWRRVMVLPLTARLDHSPDRVVDIGKIIGIREASQVARWAIDGLVRLIANGGQYTRPERTIERVEEWRVDSDEVREYLLDHMDEATFAKMNGRMGLEFKNLHAAYVAWWEANSNGVKGGGGPLNANAFSRKLTANADLVRRDRKTAVRLVFSTATLVHERLRRQAEAQAMIAALERGEDS